MKPLAATYARVSLDRQKGNYSLPSQHDAMLKLAGEKGYDVPTELQFVDDGLLGGEADRPGFQALLESVRKGRVKAILCHDLDRLARDLALQMATMDMCEKHNVALEFVTTPVEKSPEGRMLLQMKGVFAEYEKYKIRERTTRGRKQQAEMGFRPSGRPPYGYVYNGKKVGSRGELVIHDFQAEIVRRMFAEAEAGRTTGEIARGLNADGILSVTEKAWAKETVAQILRASTYMGVQYYNRREAVEPKRRRTDLTAKAGKSKRTAQKFRQESDWIEIRTPAIIEAAQFERVRERMERTRALHVGRPSREYLLRGLVKCARCGRSCAVYPNRGRPRYRCSNFNRNKPSERYCPLGEASVLVRPLEHAVWQRAKEVLSTQESFTREYTAAVEREHSDREEIQREAAKLKETIKKLEAREFRARQLYYDAALPDQAVKIRAELAAFQQERRYAEDKLKSLAIQPVIEITEDMNRERQELLERMEAAEAAGEFDVMRKILTVIVSRIDVDPGGESELHLRLFAGPADSASEDAINRMHNQPAVSSWDQPSEGDLYAARLGRGQAANCAAIVH